MIHTNSSNKKILILGAGPAGTATALELLRHHIPAKNIIIIDRQTFPRQKLCGGGITARGWERLKRWDIPLKTTLACHAIRLTDGDHSKIYKEPGLLATVDRWELDHQLLQHVIAQGIMFKQLKVNEIIPSQSGWQIITNKTTLHADYLVGANGISSHVQRVINKNRATKKNQSTKLGKLLEISIKANTTNKQPILEMDFSPISAGVHGYLWEFPYLCAHENILKIKYGIMDRSGNTPTETLKKLLAEYIVKKGAKPPEYTQGYPERYFQPFARFTYKNAIVVGDAWGVDPLLGEGIAIAFEQAEYAAKKIAKAWHKGKLLAGNKHFFYPFSLPGRNQWILKILGDQLYDKHPLFFRYLLTQAPYFADFTHHKQYTGYGRFSKHGLRLLKIAIKTVYDYKRK